MNDDHHVIEPIECTDVSRRYQSGPFGRTCAGREAVSLADTKTAHTNTGPSAARHVQKPLNEREIKGARITQLVATWCSCVIWITATSSRPLQRASNGNEVVRSQSSARPHQKKNLTVFCAITHLPARAHFTRSVDLNTAVRCLSWSSCR